MGATPKVIGTQSACTEGHTETFVKSNPDTAVASTCIKTQA